MSKQEFDTHLKYGQGIIIEGFKAEGFDSGYLTAQGFADVNVKYETSEDILYFKNYRNSLFQILPAGNFELSDELQKALIENEGQPDTPNITILRARAESEKNQFELNINNHMKKKIVFGAGVIFKHIDSQSYVSGTIKPSTGSNGAFTVQVSEKLSDSLVFRLEPYRSFEFTDMPIPFESPIKIRNEFNRGYLTFEKIGMADGSNSRDTYINKKPIESNETYNIPVKTPSLTSKVYEMVTHFVDLSVEKEVPMPWRFKLHVNNVENDILVQHDVVFLQHTENAGILATSGKNIILKELKERENEDLPFYDCLWEIEKHDATSDAYILRHLMSGMILGQEMGPNDQRTAVLVDISEGKPPEGEISYVEVKLAKKEGGQINSESFVNIAWGEEILEINEEGSGLGSSANKAGDPTAKVDLGKMRTLYKKEIEYNIKAMIFRKSVAQEHCFVIMEIPDELKEQLLFALSFHSVIIRLREDLKYGAIQAAKKISYLRMMQVTNKIREIKRFVKDCGEEEAELEHIFPQRMRQMICKDLGISELLFELLYFMKMNLREDIFSDQHNERDKFMELYQTLYDVNRELIRHNNLFKMHVSKWFEFILEDVIAGDVPVELSMLKELLLDNEFFTANFVNQDIVEYLTSCFANKNDNSDFTEKKYLEIFQLFCVSGNKVNTHNQKLIVDSFLLKIQGTGSVYEVRLEQKEGQIVVVASLDKNTQTVMPFAEFYARSQQENPSAWLYLVQYLNLMADLTQGRNKITELEVAKVFTLQILGDLFEHQALHQAEIPIIRLLHYVHAESEDYYPIEKRRRLLNYNTISSEAISVNSTLSHLKPWEPPLDRILSRLVSRIKDFGAIETRDSEGSEQGAAECFFRNRVLLTLLKFLWETVNLGFWNTKEAAKQILGEVLKICKKGEWIDYEEARVESRENRVMIECKIECLNIIQLIASIDNDVFVQNIAGRFKELDFPTKQLNLEGVLNSSILEMKCDDQLVGGFLASLPSEESIQPIIETSICDQMIELTNYRNPHLTSGAISIIDLALQSRKKAFQQFYELIIISEDERLKLVEFMETHRNKFFILDDQNTPSVNEDNQACNYFLVSDPEGTGLMEVLYLLTELMKNENNILEVDRVKGIHESGVFEALGSERLVNFTGERSSTSRMKQEIIYSSNLYKKVLNYIFNCREMPEEELAVKLLHMCYYFVVALIENFNQIKGEMQNYIPLMIHHIERNVGCIDFLKEMYDNNKSMLYNEIQVFQLIKNICENVEKEPDHSFYKSKLLDFFRYLIYCNGRCLRSHQIQILKIMQDDSYANIMVPTHQDIQPLLQEYSTKDQHVQMSPKLTYLTTFFQLMSSLIDNNNPVNIGKLVKRYSFDYLVGLIQQSANCYPLQRNIRALTNRLYYFQKGVELYLKPIISRELYSIEQNLTDYLRTELSAATKEDLKFENPVRFSYLDSYRYLLIQEDFFSLMALTNESIMEAVTKHLNKTCTSDIQPSHNILKIVERLGLLQKFFTDHKNTYTNSMIKFLLSKMKPLLLSLDDPIYAFYGDVSSQEQKEEAVHRILSGDVAIFFVENQPEITHSQPLSRYSSEPSKHLEGVPKDEGRLREILREIFLREKKPFHNEDERISYNLQTLISSLKLSIPVQVFFRREYLDKVDTYYKKKNRYKFIKRIIALNSRNPTALSSEQKIFFLQYITSFIEAGNLSPPQPEEGEPRPEIDEWEAGDWSESKSAIDKIQINLKKRDLGKFIVDLLKEDITVNIQLANAILTCAIAYLLGGNAITQKNVLEELEQDEENKVFANIEGLIYTLGKLIRKNIDETNIQKNQACQQSSNEFSPDKIDNYDFFEREQKYTMRKNVSEPNSTDEYIYNKLCITTYRRAFKFLQIMCENNCQDGKNMIRRQEGKAKQFNFIDIATKELRNLFQIFCNEIKVVPLYILDFILEVTQVPIYENQAALMSSTFFEDLCQLKAQFTFPPDTDLLDRKLGQTGFTDLSSVNEIFYKSFDIILSNFQGNDDKTFTALDNKLESKFLLEVLTEKLKQMEVENDEQLNGHIENYNNEKDDDGNMKTDFSEDLLIVLKIITIYLKMRGAAVLANNSRLDKGYRKFKKELYENKRETILEEAYVAFPEDQFPEEEERESRVEKEVQEKMASEYHCMYEHLESLLLSIQVDDGKGGTQTVFFPRYPVFSSLADSLRDQIMKEVPRDSHRDKIIGMLGYTEAVKEKIEYSYNLEKQRGITEADMTNNLWLASFFSIVICIYIGVFYSVNVEYSEAEYYAPLAIASVRFALCFIQLTFTVLFIYNWYQLRFWKAAEPQNRELSSEEEGQEEGGVVEQEPEEDLQGDAGPATIAVEEEGEPQNQEEADVGEENVALWRKHSPIWLAAQVDRAAGWGQWLTEKYESEEMAIIFNPELWRHGVFLLASVVGTFYFPAIFYLHLVIIFARNQKLGTILQAAVYNYKSLLWMYFLAFVFNYIFNTVTFSNYMRDVYSPSDHTADMCDDIVGCVSQLYVSGVIGGMEEFEFLRFSYDMIFFIFFDIMFGSIVSGIMLDAFASLREQQDARDTDKADFCYICNIKREELEKVYIPFEQHIKEHFLWNYIFYIYVLQRKDQTDYTGLEYIIRNQYFKPDEEMEVGWIPFNGGSEFDVQASAEQITSFLQNKMETIYEKKTALDDSVGQFRKLAEQYLN